ncbi:hypothetical protein BPO_1633 [Bergeyella porcorum]|uniref:Uncharacterized protein n=1 Tax=Bergeyella porcorum TaxID=1735111 RepID=A0AAU0F1T1_9FLAO
MRCSSKKITSEGFQRQEQTLEKAKDVLEKTQGMLDEMIYI